MFYRVTTYEFEPEREDEIASWTATKTEQVRSIDGLVAVDVFNAEPGLGVIVAAYEDRDAFETASATIASVLGELGAFLNAPPNTRSGAPFWTTRVEAATSS